MLAGGIIHAIVTEVKSKKEAPEKNEIVYLIAAEDREEKMKYMVEVYVKSKCDLKKGLMVLYVERMTLSYKERTGENMSLEDLEGDGFIDLVRRGNAAFFPPVPYTSGEYMLQKSKGSLRGSDPVFDVALVPESPWYAFFERERIEDSSPREARGMNVYPLQQRFTRIAVAALRELNFSSSNARGS